MKKNFLRKFDLLVFLNSLVIILSPLYVLRAKIIIPTTLLEILILVTFLLTTFEIIKTRYNVSKLKTRFDIPILVLLVSATFASSYSPDKIGALGILKAYFFEPAVFYYCLIYQVNKRGYNFILKSLLLSGFWIAILGIIQKITGNFSLASYELQLNRVPAFYNSANSLALYLSPIAIIAAGLFIGIKKRGEKLLNLFLFSLSTIIILFTRSRGGIIALAGALSILVFTLISLKLKILKRIWYLVPIICLFFVTMFILFSYQNYHFFPPDVPAKGDTLQIRYLIWISSLNMIKDNLVLGVGLDGFQESYSQNYQLPQTEEEFQYPHNLILTFWTETGIFGLFSFLLIFVTGISLILRVISKSSKPFLGAAYLGVLSYIFIHGVVDVPFFKNDLSVQFFVIIALIEVWSRGAKVNI